MSYDEQQRRGGNRARAPPMSMRAPPPQQQGYQQQPYQNDRAPSMMPQNNWVDPRYSNYAPPQQSRYQQGYGTPQQGYAAPPPQQQYDAPPQRNDRYDRPQQRYDAPPQRNDRYDGHPQRYDSPQQPRSPQNYPPKGPPKQQATWSDSASESSINDDPRYRNQDVKRYEPYNPSTGPRQPPSGQKYGKFSGGNGKGGKGDDAKSNPNIPTRSYALDGEDDKTKRTNKGNTKALMALIAEMWIFHIAIIM
ncbi:hypothetical protein HK096_000927, partial [Nowakowskiella sp. JEL0078]